MKILAIDTSTPYVFIGHCVFDRTWSVTDFSISKIQRDQDNWLEILVNDFCKHTPLYDYDGYAVGRGPGSFTGLRIGYTYFKALALLWNKVFVDFPTPALMNSIFCPPSGILLIQLNTTLYYTCDPEYAGSEILHPLTVWEEIYRDALRDSGKKILIWNIFARGELRGNFAALDPESEMLQKNVTANITLNLPDPEMLIRDKNLTVSSLPFYGHNVVVTRKN